MAGNKSKLQDKIQRDFGSNLKSLRLSSSMSRKKLAELTGRDVSQISKIESGTSGATFGFISSVCEIFSCEVSELFSSKLAAETVNSPSSDAKLFLKRVKLATSDLVARNSLLENELESVKKVHRLPDIRGINSKLVEKLPMLSEKAQSLLVDFVESYMEGDSLGTGRDKKSTLD